MQGKLQSNVALAQDRTAAPARRLKACDWLLSEGHIDPAFPALMELTLDPKWAGAAKVLVRTAQFMKKSGLVSDVQRIGARPDAISQMSSETGAVLWQARDPGLRKVSFLIVFTGKDKRFWVSLDLLHRLIRTRVGSALYLRDQRNLYYLAGIAGIGQDYASTLAGLRRIVRDAGAETLTVMGTSLGGPAALQYGLDLEADAVLAFSPRTNLEEKFAGDPAPEEHAAITAEVRRSLGLDLARNYDQAARRPQTTIVYGGLHAGDVAQAERMAHLPEVRLMPLPNFDGHDTIAYLIATGRFTGLLDGLFQR